MSPVKDYGFDFGFGDNFPSPSTMLKDTWYYVGFLGSLVLSLALLLDRITALKVANLLSYSTPILF